MTAAGRLCRIVVARTAGGGYGPVVLRLPDVMCPVPLGFLVRRHGVAVAGSPGLLARCQRRLINLPGLQVCINFLGWLPGAVAFPLGIGLLGGWERIGPIWGQFAVSFVVSALLTTVQTYFVLEAFL